MSILTTMSTMIPVVRLLKSSSLAGFYALACCPSGQHIAQIFRGAVEKFV
jgi:hypothetical protein